MRSTYLRRNLTQIRDSTSDRHLQRLLAEVAPSREAEGLPPPDEPPARVGDGPLLRAE